MCAYMLYGIVMIGMSQVNGMELWWSVKGRLLPPIYNGEWMLCYYLNPQKRFWI